MPSRFAHPVIVSLSPRCSCRTAFGPRRPGTAEVDREGEAGTTSAAAGMVVALAGEATVARTSPHLAQLRLPPSRLATLHLRQNTTLLPPPWIIWAAALARR